MERITCCWFMTSMFVVRLHGEMQPLDEEALGFNYTTLWELLKLQTNPYLQDLHGHWSFNDTIDISKYEEFDHTRFQGSREMSLDEILKKVKDMTRGGRRRPDPQRTTQSPDELPVFDSSHVTNVTAQLGGTAFLHCRVKNLNNRAVSWVRKRDWHILTSAMFTYTNDERFQVLHNEGSDDWTLQIKYVQKRDNGAYECQVSTDRGTISHFFILEVAVPVAHILGTREVHVGRGSSISLVCIIENSPTPPQFVMWYHNDKMINYDAGGERAKSLKIMTEAGEDETHSKLLIDSAGPSHSGSYSCRASNSLPDSVLVFVSTDGRSYSAMRSGAGFCGSCRRAHCS